MMKLIKLRKQPKAPDSLTKEEAARIEDSLIFDPFVIKEELITPEEAERLKKLIKEGFAKKDQEGTHGHQ